MSVTIPIQDRLATLRVSPSIPDQRDAYLFAAAPHLLPPQADLGVRVPHKDQGRQGSCTGHGYSSMVEVLEVQAGKPYVPLARAFIYAEERLREHAIDQDAGAMPLDGCKVLRAMGVCREDEMPYDDKVWNVRPSKTIEHSANTHKIGGYAKLLGSAAVKYATVLKHPVGFGIAVYDSFERIGSDGVMPMPAPSESMLGGHWVFGNAGGYVDDITWPGGGYFIVQNSWGDAWGKGGDLLMPYAYVDNPNLTFECRAIM